MTCNILILRPEPGADETAARALLLGLRPIVAPLFIVRPLPWSAPDPGQFDAVMLTSANAARHGGDGLEPFLRLPCYALGDATAAAARDAGFADLRVGPSDGAALLALMEAQGIECAFHPTGRDRTELGRSRLRRVEIPVYAAEAVHGLPPEADAAVREGALVLLHSPRAAALFDALFEGDREFVDLAALSPAVAQAAGAGWRSVSVAPQPRDHALLELACKLCQTAHG